MTEKLSTCPECSHTRKKKHDKCMSTNIETGLFNCFHCGFKGILKSHKATQTHKRMSILHKDIKLPEKSLSANLIKYFRDRGISEEILIRNRISSNGKEILFPYIKHGNIINIKYKTKNKRFRQEAGAEKIFYGIDDIAEHKTVIIVEGEMDKLSFNEAGFNNVISVPDGAPAVNTKAYSTKFDYIENCEKELEHVEKFIIATDNDQPGIKLKYELVRRLSPENCWYVEYPDECKDANDILVKHSDFMLMSVIDNAKPCPVNGIFTVNDFENEILNLYYNNDAGGISTGWANIDKYYTVKSGELTIVTGIPSHGKSEYIDALTLNLCKLHSWRIAYFSPENFPIEKHISKMIRKSIRKPFSINYNGHLEENELEAEIKYLNNLVYFISPNDEELKISDILGKAKALIKRYGIKGLVIDPWNEIDHSRPIYMTETEYISDCLTKIRRFARKHDIHVWLIAHPTKLKKEINNKYPVPTPYDIAGSANFRNKADNCISVWRDLQDEESSVEIHIQKIRFRDVGKIGMEKLKYDIPTGTYREESVYCEY